MIFQNKSVEECINKMDICFLRRNKAIINHFKPKLALVVCFKNFFQRNPYFVSQIRKEINPLGSITLELGNVIEIWWKNRFTLHNFKEGGCIADETEKGFEGKT